MFQRFHAARERNERGFTLIELLVVILIIAILAAIAIPAFLKQREKGWIGQQQSALKNAATAAESFATANNGSYAPGGTAMTKANLTSNGFNDTQDVTLTVVSATGTAYCLKAVHSPATVDYYYSSTVGNPSTTACT
jgi:type IV pilus assembly protein PilA